MTKENHLGNQDLVYRLRKLAEIRRGNTERKSVQEGRADRISDILEEAADEIDNLRLTIMALEEREEALEIEIMDREERKA